MTTCAWLLQERIRQLDEEILPEQYRSRTEMERRLAETFSETYRDDIGLPRYRQELERRHRPDIVYRNFSSHAAISSLISAISCFC